ncbi:MAG: MBL fold metallo-hydrolase [Candidatus Krumholzibacteriota bacterium]|nr:MBL fold metallo-hydrolase [Candidatus Krumholzibacteriota bacterium]
MSVLFVLLCFYLTLTVGGGGTAIQFLGAAREVGGSCHLVETPEVSFLVDCGSFGQAGYEVLPPHPADISFVLLTHAHSDHCGLLPELYAGGFQGKVFCSQATRELVPIMLRMSRGWGESKVSREKFEQALKGLVAVPWGERREAGEVSFRFRKAEHLLGAAFIEVWIESGENETKLVFSGDLGSGNSILLPPPEHCAGADYLVLESTYGGTVRKSRREGPREHYGDFARAVAAALKRGGDVLIPAFTLGRTQEVIAVLDYFTAAGVIPSETMIYVDSPTAKKINQVYRRFDDHLSSRVEEFYGPETLKRPSLREVRSKTSLQVHSRKHVPSIFISSSGNLDYANAPRHLMKMYSDPNNLLCLVGYQSPQSLGARLARGDSLVLVGYREGRRTEKVWIQPSLEVRSFDSFSSHADQVQLIDWLKEIRGVKKVFLVHGEVEQSQALARRIETELGIITKIPRPGERYHISRGSPREEKALGWNGTGR